MFSVLTCFPGLKERCGYYPATAKEAATGLDRVEKVELQQGNVRSVTTRVHFRQICKLYRKIGEQILDSIKLCVEIHHVPSGKLPRIASKLAFSLHWGQTDGLVLCPPNSTEGIPHFDSTVSCHRRHRCQPVPRLCLRASSMLCTQIDISIKWNDSGVGSNGLCGYYIGTLFLSLIVTQRKEKLTNSSSSSSSSESSPSVGRGVSSTEHRPGAHPISFFRSIRNTSPILAIPASKPESGLSVSH